MKYIKTYEFNFFKKVKEIIEPIIEPKDNKNYVHELITVLYDFINKYSIDKPEITGDTSTRRMSKNRQEIHIAGRNLIIVHGSDWNDDSFTISINIIKFVNAQDFEFILDYITDILEKNCEMDKGKVRISKTFYANTNQMKNIIKELEDVEKFDFLSTTNKYNL